MQYFILKCICLFGNLQCTTFANAIFCTLWGGPHGENLNNKKRWNNKKSEKTQSNKKQKSWGCLGYQKPKNNWTKKGNFPEILVGMPGIPKTKKNLEKELKTRKQKNINFPEVLDTGEGQPRGSVFFCFFRALFLVSQAFPRHLENCLSCFLLFRFFQQFFLAFGIPGIPKTSGFFFTIYF